MMSARCVSVIMSVYNGAQFLHEAVESILDQSFSDFDFIIINDGSTDGTESILNYYLRKDFRVRVFHQENRGLTASLNRCLDLSRSKYLARMDADDIAIKDRLKWQVQLMEEQPELGALGGAVEVIDSSGQAVGILRFPTKDRDIKAGLLAGECTLCNPTTLIRLDAMRSVGGYRNVVVDAEDYDLWLRIADRFQLANLEIPVLRYRRHPNQVSVKKFKRQALSNLAARIAALSRRHGKEDFLNNIQEITPLILANHGVSEEMQHAVLARGYLTCIRSMIDAGEYSIANETMSEMVNSSCWKNAEKSLVADSYLLAARLHWRQNRATECLFNLAQAVISRPIILARPLKSSLRRFGINLRFDIFIAKWFPSLGKGRMRHSSGRYS